MSTGRPQLPVHLYAPTVATAELDQEFWLTPWSMWVDDDGYAWVHADAARHERPGGTVTLRAVRLRDGVAVELPVDDSYQWTPCGPNPDRAALPVLAWIR